MYVDYDQIVVFDLQCHLSFLIIFFLKKQLKYQFTPTEVKINSQKATIFDDTVIVLTDCNYTLLIYGEETTHHFAVTEAYIHRNNEWKLIQFSFTALVY